MDVLMRRADLLRESMRKSQMITERMVSVLGSFDNRLSSVESSMRPIQMKTHALRVADENIGKALRSADSIASQFDRIHEAEEQISRGPKKNVGSFLDAIDILREISQGFNKRRDNDVVLNFVNKLLSDAITKLAQEFHRQLSILSKPVSPEEIYTALHLPVVPQEDKSNFEVKQASSDVSENQPTVENTVYTIPLLIDPSYVSSLSTIAQQLINAGHRSQCVQIYRTRASTLEASLKNLGVEKVTYEDVRRLPSHIYDSNVETWIPLVHISVKLFSAERQLCDQIFEGSKSLSEECFVGVIGDNLALLLSFGEAIGKSKIQLEKFFVVLNMYEAMFEVKPDVEDIFSGQMCAEKKEYYIVVKRNLAIALQSTMNGFEQIIQKDTSKTVVPDGTVHPLTSYVTNYVKFMFDYQSTLKHLFQELGTGDETNSQLASIATQIMHALQTNLELKAKQYKDPSLMHIFLMNNIHYIVKSVRRSDGKDILGDDWIQRQRRTVQQNATQYKRISWQKVFQMLSSQGLSSSSGSGTLLDSDASRSAVKERFKLFADAFDELYQTQRQWVVPEEELRETLRLSVAEILQPAYRNFVKRFG